MSDEKVDFTDAAHEQGSVDERSDNPVEPLTQSAPQAGANILTTDEAGLVFIPPPLEISSLFDWTIVNRSNVFIFKIPHWDQHHVWFNYWVNGALTNSFEWRYFPGEKWNHHPVDSASSGVGVYEAYWKYGAHYSEKIYRYVYVSDQPVITYPAQNQVVADRQLRITGTGGEGCNLRVMNSHSGEPLSATFTANANQWAINLNQPLPYGDYSIVVEQSSPGFTSRNSAVRNFKLYDATLFKPREGDVLRQNDIIFTGESVAGAALQIVDAEKLNVVYSPSITVPTSGYWEVLPNPMLPIGEYKVKVRWQMYGGTFYYSDAVTFTVAGVPPFITIPVSGSTLEQTFTLSGHTGLAGATVEILKDLDKHTVLGTGPVKAGGFWDVTVTVSPGPISLAAEQFIGSGEHSGRSRERSYNIRPPKVELLDAVATNGTVTITGTGYIGARLEIWYTQGDVVKTFDVTETLWTKTYPDWLPGSYSIDAKQKVIGLSNAWIDSEWNTKPVIFDVKVPPPTLTHQVGIDQKPKFSGTGNGWAGHAPAKVELRITSSSNSILPSMPIVDVKNNRWSNDALEQWDPGTYSVEARQLFTPTGKPQLSSDWTGPQQVVIKAPLPAIDPIVENGLSPDITGTCWKGAVVTLFFSDAITTAHPVPDSDRDGRWTFRRPALFKPGSHTVKATQTFGGQTSNEVTKPFTVDVPTPVIKPMTPPVGYEPIITGTGGYAGAEMTIYDYANNRPLGKAMVIGEAWTVPLLELEFREYQIYAVQSFDKLPSGRSELISFKAVLLPPTVDTPKPGDTVARTFRIEGHGSRASGSEVAQVCVWRGEELEPWDRIRVKYDGTWYYDATLPLGTETLRFKQFFKGQASEFTLDHVLGVVPAHPVIETPARGEAIESRVAISGFGYGGDTVSVAFADALDVILGTTQVLENGTWSLWLLLDRPAGHPSLVAQQSFRDYLSGWTTPRPVELRPQPPQFTAPLPGRWVKSQPTFAGTAMPGAEIRLQAWFNPDIDLITSPAVGEDWEATPPNELPRSEHWVCAVQSVKEGGEQVSATADSARFEIMPAQGRGADLNP